jgi:hypothetical protein
VSKRFEPLEARRRAVQDLGRPGRGRSRSQAVLLVHDRPEQEAREGLELAQGADLLLHERDRQVELRPRGERRAALGQVAAQPRA